MSDRVHLKGDWDKFQGTLRQLSNYDFKSINKEIGQTMVERSRDHFEDESGPDGEKWPKSLRAKGDEGKTLQVTRKLEKSITYKATKFQVAIGTNDIRARVHNYGLKIRAKNAKSLCFKIGEDVILKKAVQMPRRQFIGLGKQDVKDLEEIIAKRIAKEVLV